MQLPELSAFSLVGGTALSLRHGHRRSVDLDLFTTEPFDRDVVIAALSTEFGPGLVLTPSKAAWAIFGFIEEVKVDLVKLQHPRIADIVTEEGVRMYADADIAAMKVQAILGRGKKKDFWDMSELLQHHPLQWVMDRHREKYPNQQLAISIPNALLYFADADKSEDPVCLKGRTWPEVKEVVRDAVDRYLR
ncbi:MAG: nucleotidyl transferase AbiEii/AbiGii toxin family protein [Flavobacteriales bacterium]|nr:nucleotidyl transferase AbiEii/AbiGii toxin family protein [Flavobacteriales bacterium]